MNSRIIVRLAAVLGLLFVGGIAYAASHDPQYVWMGNKGPFGSRSDGIGFDKSMYGPLLITNGTVDQAFGSSLMVNLREDFLGLFVLPDADSLDLAEGVWARQDAGSQATCGSRLGDADDGAISLLIDNGNEVGDCTVYWGDEQNIDSDKEPIMIARVQVLATPASTDKVFWGLGSARNAILESMTAFAGFSVTGADLTLDVESDDNSTDVAPVSTGVTLTSATYYEFMICMNTICGGSPTNVKFFHRAALGGAWTADNTSTTFAVGADVALQPILQAEKTSSTATPGIQVDYVTVFWERS